MSFRRAFSTLGCPDLTLEQALALAREHKFDGLELRALAGTLNLASHFTASYGTPAVLAAKLNAQPVKVVALDTSLRLAENTPVDREALVEIVPWAEAMGVPHLRVFDGGRRADEPELDRMAVTLQWWRELRAQHGWQTDLMVETHDSLYTVAAVERLLLLAPGTSILWDAHHTWKLGREDPLITWRKLHAQIVHIHVKDSINQPGERHPYTYVLPGTGEFPASSLLAELRRHFTGTVSLEWEKHWHPTLPSLSAALDAGWKNGWWG